MQDVIKVKAAYQNHNYGETGNPFIECLPPDIPREEDLMNEFDYFPELPENLAFLDIEERLDLLNLIEDIRIPILSQINCARQIQSLIRTAYKGRNPVLLEDLKRCREREEDITSANFMRKVKRKPIITTKRTKTFLGVSGAGKTTTALTACGMYPQVIEHTFYNGETFNREQILYLHVECPSSGDLKSFINNIIHEFDRVLDNDTHYTNLYSDMNINDKILSIGNLIDLHGLGLLMIDEIQNLTNRSEGKKLHSQITMMINIWKIPILFIGTPLACSLFNSEFRSNRRMGDTSMKLERLNESMLESGEDFDTFLAGLWEFQVTKNYTELTQELSQMFYEKTQGIVDLIKLLFERVQSYVIRDPMNEEETITEPIITRVFEEEFRPVRKAIEAVRSGNINQMERFGDILMDFKEDILNKNVLDSSSGYYSELRKDRIKQKKILKIQICDSLFNEERFSCLTKADIRNIAEECLKNINDSDLKHPEDIIGEAYLKAIENVSLKEVEIPRKVSNKRNNKCPILSTHNQKIKKKLSAYELLKEKGLIANYNEFYRFN